MSRLSQWKQTAYAVNDPRYNWAPEQWYAQATGNPLAVEMNKPAHMPHLENFLAACRHGEKLNCPAELAYESAVAVLAANTAADTRKTHYFKPEDFKVPPRKA